MIAPELLERRRDGLDVDNLAVTHGADRKLGSRDALELHVAVDRDLGGDDATRFDIESDRPRRGVLAK